MAIDFSTKANTLLALHGKLKNAVVLPQVCFTVAQWNSNPEIIIDKIYLMLSGNLVVRSSAYDEDSKTQSLAGKYNSTLNIKSKKDLIAAIDKTILSYSHEQNINNQILVQPMLENISISGVAFTKDPNSGSYYYIINYDDTSGNSDSVTNGSTSQLKTFFYFKNSNIKVSSELQKIIALLKELEVLFATENIDIEFAFDNNMLLYLFQARPLVIKNISASYDLVHNELKNINAKIKLLTMRHPYLYGDYNILGVMPDWNPAEIIGIRPKPLALSLYKELVTDLVWAYQRNNYGYKNLRSFPLLINFSGLPYIDVRVSFNSFIPSNINNKLAEKLVNYYLDELKKYPHNHDKVEFAIIYSCYTLDLPDRLKNLKNYNFTQKEIDILSAHLRSVTNNIINNNNGIWRDDVKKINVLKQKYCTIYNSNLDDIAKIYWLLEDCKRYGTLPFAGLARAGFIAIQLLQSLIAIKVISKKEYNDFLSDLKTISSQLAADHKYIKQNKFLQKYGHLRPGTYDITSPRYDEMPKKYFDWSGQPKEKLQKKISFNLSLKQFKSIRDLLEQNDLDNDVISFFDFIKSAIVGREYAKFIFTKSLSKALQIFKNMALENGFDANSAAFANIDCIYKLYSATGNIKNILQNSITDGYEKYKITKSIHLPPIIFSSDEVYAFHMPSTVPNFVTNKIIDGKIIVLDDKKNISGYILLIPSADPGFDWIFSHNILGFITMYGGANSHMAIRANELQIPAVIGAGELMYKNLEKKQIIRIDCCNKKIDILS